MTWSPHDRPHPDELVEHLGGVLAAQNSSEQLPWLTRQRMGKLFDELAADVRGGSVCSASELRELLARDVVPAVGSADRYEFRLVARALEIIERELGEPTEARTRHRRVLDELGVTEVSELAAAVRAGVFDERYDTLATALRTIVRDKLLVSNPRYLDDGQIPEPLACNRRRRSEGAPS